MYNLKKYFGILDYALRVFSKCFPLYEIPLNIQHFPPGALRKFLQNCLQKIESLRGPH